MQAGIDSSRLSIAGEVFATNVANITPAPVSAATAVNPTADASTSTASSGKSFFSASNDAPSFRDVLDAINPLNHIPVVSTIYQHAVGHTPSTASNLVGGTLYGGPIGFVASLASEIVDSATGSSPAEKLYAALTGDSSTQVASANSNGEQQVASLDTGSAAAAMALLAPASATAQAAPVDAVTSSNTAAATAASTTGNAAVLDLYGGSSSAHASYKKAQLLPYLRDVNTSKVL